MRHALRMPPPFDQTPTGTGATTSCLSPSFSLPPDQTYTSTLPWTLLPQSAAHPDSLVSMVLAHSSLSPVACAFTPCHAVVKSLGRTLRALQDASLQRDLRGQGCKISAYATNPPFADGALHTSPVSHLLINDNLALGVSPHLPMLQDRTPPL